MTQGHTENWTPGTNWELVRYQLRIAEDLLYDARHLAVQDGEIFDLLTEALDKVNDCLVASQGRITEAKE